MYRTEIIEHLLTDYLVENVMSNWYKTHPLGRNLTTLRTTKPKLRNYSRSPARLTL